MNAPHGIYRGGPANGELLRSPVDPAHSQIPMRGGRYLRTDEHDYSAGQALLIWIWAPAH